MAEGSLVIYLIKPRVKNIFTGNLIISHSNNIQKNNQSSYFIHKKVHYPYWPIRLKGMFCSRSHLRL